MKKAAIIAMALSIIAIGLSAVSFVRKPKYAYVEVNKILENYNYAAKARAELDSIKDGINGELSQINDSLESLKAQASKIKSPKELGELQKRFIQLKANESEYKKASKDKLMKAEEMKMGPVLAKVNDFIYKYGKQNGYIFVFGAVGNGSMMFADEAYDITDRLIAAINGEAK